MNFPPPPQFIGNLGAEHLHEEHLGVSLDYWGTDKSVKEQLTTEELLALHMLPGKTGCSILITKAKSRIAIYFNTEDPSGQYALFEIRTDYDKLTQIGEVYVQALHDLVLKLVREAVGDRITCKKVVAKYGDDLPPLDLSEFTKGN